MTGRSPFAVKAGHLSIIVHLTPKAAIDRIDGIVAKAAGDFVLAARVRAIPEDGRANASLEKLLAKAFRLPRSAVSVTSGHKARLKQLRVNGEPERLLDLARSLWPNSADKNRAES